MKNNSPFLPALSSISLPWSNQLLINPSRDALCTCENRQMLVLFILQIYLILYLKVDGSMLHVPYVPCFSHLINLRVCSIISRQYNAEVKKHRGVGFEQTLLLTSYVILDKFLDFSGP